MPHLDRGHYAQLLVSMLGVWLMAAPDVLGYGAPLADSNRVVGPLLVTVGGVAIWEVTRMTRLATLPLAGWLLVSPWIFDAPTVAIVSNMATGIAAGLLSLVHGQVPDKFGGGWVAVWSSDSPYEDVTRTRQSAELGEQVRTGNGA